MLKLKLHFDILEIIELEWTNYDELNTVRWVEQMSEKLHFDV